MLGRFVVGRFMDNMSRSIGEICGHVSLCWGDLWSEGGGQDSYVGGGGAGWDGMGPRL